MGLTEDKEKKNQYEGNSELNQVIDKTGISVLRGFQNPTGKSPEEPVLNSADAVLESLLVWISLPVCRNPLFAISAVTCATWVQGKRVPETHRAKAKGRAECCSHSAVQS